MPFCTEVRRWAALLAVLALALGGCGREEPRPDVQKIADALRREGVAYEVSETAALASIRAEGLRLTGPGLEVEVYAIDDEDDVERALTATARMAAQQREAGVALPAKGYACGAVFALVRKEPVEGRVGDALERIMAE
jgi:hypothetical protein